MTALVYGFVRAAERRVERRRDDRVVRRRALLLAAFVAVERRAPHPITPLRAVRRPPPRAGAYVARLLLVAGMMGTFFFLTLFLQDVLGYSPLQTGLAFLPLTAALFLASQLSARVFVEQFGAAPVMVVGIAFSASACWR